MNGNGFDVKQDDLSPKKVTNNLGTLNEEINEYPPVFSPYNARVQKRCFNQVSATYEALLFPVDSACEKL
ncbi:hypothetical protein DYBT9623_01720 [Dyadobacter sp. CECT 9623]|uniref:Uncharacterized protein n=1 Tax=Dyadobacter linearis TaxID=2823330 RepID=A0ABN7R4F7_9BACT|nr:hypothetical protein DYBT9623_01720 [Dyadobacter sp. CECT 9623]